MRLTFKRKLYRTYEFLPEEEALVRKVIAQDGVDNFAEMLLLSEAIYTAFEDQWELLAADREALIGLRGTK